MESTCKDCGVSYFKLEGDLSIICSSCQRKYIKLLMFEGLDLELSSCGGSR